MTETVFDNTHSANEQWRTIMRRKLRGAKTFEIHCWAEESKWISLACRYGQIKETDWRWGKVISGSVTAEFADFILNLPSGNDTEIYNKMTPFFSIFLDNGFASEHYGTELNQL